MTAQRRDNTIRLVRSGMSYRKVVEALDKLGIKSSTATVTRDLKALYKEYRDQSLTSVEDVMTRDLERLDDLMGAVWFSAKGGNLKAMDRAIRLIEQRARILGYEEISIREHSATSKVGDLTPEEEAMLLGALHAMREGRTPPGFDEQRYLPPADQDAPPPPPEELQRAIRDAE